MSCLGEVKIDVFVKNKEVKYKLKQIETYA